MGYEYVFVSAVYAEFLLVRTVRVFITLSDVTFESISSCDTVAVEFSCSKSVVILIKSSLLLKSFSLSRSQYGREVSGVTYLAVGYEYHLHGNRVSEGSGCRRVAG